MLLIPDPTLTRLVLIYILGAGQQDEPRKGVKKLCTLEKFFCVGLMS